MADFFVWNPKTLALNVPSMDDEHKVLIHKMNALHAAHARGADRAALGKLLGDLASYTREHFADEERYMASVKYAGLDVHKIIHERLLAQLGEHAAAFERSGKLSDAFFSFLSFWLTSHIQGIDMQYASTPVKRAG